VGLSRGRRGGGGLEDVEGEAGGGGDGVVGDSVQKERLGKTRRASEKRRERH
jgi:hypothetical protein